MKKQWFDKRAEDGREWVVSRESKRMFDVRTFTVNIVTTYTPEQKHKANGKKVMARGMTKAEAIAMVKLLDATS